MYVYRKESVIYRLITKQATAPLRFKPGKHCGWDLIDATGKYCGWFGFNGNAKQRRQQRREFLRAVNGRAPKPVHYKLDWVEV